ncbi:MAG: nucleotidyltransferase family protein [Alphaproteobacteria bacterium]|nr:nucleotidyltransferase family protein [Alphaproteobacteria bacterium]
MNRPHASILILAAGASRRMRGADKMLEVVDGVAQLRRITRAALATGCPVTVTLPPDHPARAVALAGLAARQVIVADARAGMSASIRAGLAALPPGAAVLVVLADLPELTATDLRAMLAAQGETPDLIVRACSASGVPGHPVCFPPWTRDELMALIGDTGARDLLARQVGRTRMLPLPGDHAVTDLDTPEAWAAWRAALGTSRP